MALKWMNTSAPPSRPRKPYPFGLLNHLTLPLMRSTGVLALFCRLAQQGKIVVAKGKNYRMISCQPPTDLYVQNCTSSIKAGLPYGFAYRGCWMQLRSFGRIENSDILS